MELNITNAFPINMQTRYHKCHDEGDWGSYFEDILLGSSGCCKSRLIRYASKGFKEIYLLEECHASIWRMKMNLFIVSNTQISLYQSTLGNGKYYFFSCFIVAIHSYRPSFEFGKSKMV